MSAYTTLVRFFQDGGLFMYPIMVVFAVGIAIGIERYLYISRSRQVNKKLWKQLLPMIQAGEFKKAMAITQRSKAAMSQILHYGLSRISTARRRDDLETAMEEGLLEAVPKLEKRTHYLAAFANIATLLGLLGTIIGLINAFTAVAKADPAQKADLLSASISIAMNTTAFGLVAAIPLLLMYIYLQSKATEVIDSLEMASLKFLNIITEQSSSGGKS